MPGVRQVALSSLHVTAINYAVYFINIFVQAAMARLLLPGDYGNFALAVSVVEIMFVVFALDFSTAALRMGGQDRVYESATTLSLLNIAALLAIGALALVLFQGRFDGTVVRVFCIVYLFRSLNLLSKVFLTYLEKDFLFLRSNLLRAAVRIVSMGAGLWMAALGFGVYSLVAIEAINCLVLLVLSVRYSPLRFKLRDLDAGILKSTLAQSMSLLNNRISNVLYYRLPNVIIGAFTQDKFIIGNLDRALYWAGLPNTVTAAFHSQILFVVLARNQEKKAVLADSINWALWLMARAAICFSLILWFFPETLVLLALGKNWLPVAPILKYLGPYSFFVLLYNIMIQAFVGLKREAVLTRLQHASNATLAATIAAILHFDAGWEWLALAFSATTALVFAALAVLVQSSGIRVRLWFVFRNPLTLAALAAGSAPFLWNAGALQGTGILLATFLLLLFAFDRRDILAIIRLVRSA